MEQTPRIGDADLSTATTLEEFTLLLRRLHVRAGRPSYRDLEKWATAQRQAGRGLWLNKSTLSDALTGKRLPTKAFVAAFVEACGLTADQYDSWILAWERVAEHHHLLNPPVPQQRALRLRELQHSYNELKAQHDDLKWYVAELEQDVPDQSPVLARNVAGGSPRRAYLIAISTLLRLRITVGSTLESARRQAEQIMASARLDAAALREASPAAGELLSEVDYVIEDKALHLAELLERVGSDPPGVSTEELNQIEATTVAHLLSRMTPMLAGRQLSLMEPSRAAECLSAMAASEAAERLALVAPAFAVEILEGVEATQEDVIRWLEHMTATEASEILSAMSSSKSSDVLSAMSPRMAVQRLSHMEPEVAADRLAKMNPNDAAVRLGRFARPKAVGLLSKMRLASAADVLAVMDAAAVAELAAVEATKALEWLPAMSRVEAAQVLEAMDIQHAVSLLQAMRPSVAAEYISVMETTTASEVLAGMSPEATTQRLKEMATAKSASLLAGLRTEIAARMLFHMSDDLQGRYLDAMLPSRAHGLRLAISALSEPA